MRLAILFFLLAAGFPSARAQSIEKDVIRWTVTNLSDTEAKVDTSYNCQFISYGDEKIDWIQGDYVIHLTVRQTVGNWTDLASDGSIIFSVRMKDKPGRIRFSRVSGKIKIWMEFMDVSKNSTPYEFAVSEINKIEP